MDFVQVFLLDSFGSRTWVDHDQAASFVNGVLTAFRDKVGPDSRYHDAGSKEKIRLVALNMVRVNIERQENVRGLVRAVTALSSYDECRALAAKRLVVGGWVQDPNLARQVKDLFEILCARTISDSAFDMEALRCLLSPVLATMSQSYLNEHRTRLLANNPAFPIQALSIALLENNVAETVRLALAAFPNDQTRARQSGALLFKFCSNKGVMDPAETALKLLSAYPRLPRLDLCVGLLQADAELSLEAANRVISTYRAIVSWQMTTELTEPVRATLVEIMAVAARWAVNASIEALASLLFVLPSDLSFSTLPATDAILDSVSSVGPMSPARLGLIAALVMRSARFGQLNLSPAFAPVFIERVMRNSVEFNDVWTPSMIVAVTAVLCGLPAAGAAAIQHATVRKLIMMLVTRRFVSHVPTHVLTQLQSVSALGPLATRSRDPDFVVMTLQEDPDAMQTAPQWLPQLLASGDASLLNGLPVDAALKTLLTATKGGSNSPLFPHAALLASKIDLKDEAVANSLISQLLQVGSADRASACAALAHCRGEFSFAKSVQLFLGALEVETDTKRLVLLLQRCVLDESGTKHVAEAMMRTLERRLGLRKCLAASVELQMILLRVASAAGKVDGSSLLALLPHDSKLSPEALALKGKVKTSQSAAGSFAATTAAVSSVITSAAAATAKSSPSTSWWMAKVGESSMLVVKKQEMVSVPNRVQVPKSPDWSSHPGVLADMASSSSSSELPIAPAGREGVSSARSDAARNAVLCIINNSPLAGLACKVLLKYPPDSSAATALMQFAISSRPLNMEAMLVACAEASFESMEAALDTLLSLPLNSSYERRVRLFFQTVLSSKRLSKWAVDHAGTFCKLLATRGGMSWDEAEKNCALFGVDVAPINHNFLVGQAVNFMQSEMASARAEAYETIFWSLVGCNDDVKELVLREWRLACVSPNLGIVTDAVTSAAVLHLLLGPEARVRDWLVKIHGPRSAADALRASLIAKGFASF